MSDGITLRSVCCKYSYMIKKETDYLQVQLRRFELKHSEEAIWYESNLPVYTCQKCKKQWVVERVNQ